MVHDYGLCAMVLTAQDGDLKEKETQHSFAGLLNIYIICNGVSGGIGEGTSLFQKLPGVNSY